LPKYSETILSSKIKGIVYCAGMSHWGQAYKSPSVGEMKEALTVIREELGCNGIRIYGDDYNNLINCAELATGHNFTIIMLSPSFMDLYPNEIIKEFSNFIKQVIPLAKKSNSIVVSVGNEFTLETRGWIDKPTYDERRKEDISNPFLKRQNPEGLNKIISDLDNLIPSELKGKIKRTYTRGGWEEVD
ncbi:MAG: hypothetical protein QXJ15_03315, partial [Candidatus Bathyarchaeia archaeon]